MKLSDLHKSLTDIADNSDEYANNEIEDALTAVANLVLLLDDWATAREKIQRIEGKYNVVWDALGDYMSAEAALLDACEGGVMNDQ